MNLTMPLVVNAETIPEKICIICDERHYSFQEFNEEVNRIAHGLLQHDIKKGQHISVFMKNSDYFAIAAYAIWKIGAVLVPINFRLAPPEVRYIVEQSKSVLLFCDAQLEAIAYEAIKEQQVLKTVIVQPIATQPHFLSWQDIYSHKVNEPSVIITSDDHAEILYTSGTTGQPKGALFDYKRIVAVNDGIKEIFKTTAEDVYIHIAPLFHAAQLNLFFTTAISQGATAIIQRDFEPKKVLQQIAKYKVTIFFAVPAMYNALVHADDGHSNLSSVRACAYGAAPMAPTLVQESMKLFKTDQFYNLCGLTEAGPGGVFLSPEDHQKKLGAGGKAMPNSMVRVVNTAFEDVAPGEIGEFIIQGAAVMKKYYDKPQETAEAFKDGWLVTGDLAMMDEEGFITLVDRKKDMIISGGENVYSVEVEQILNGYPAILEAAIIGLPDEKWGEMVVGILVLKEGTILDEQHLHDYCKQKLARYKMPKKYIYADTLPRNESGKILKYKLRETL
ncbi:class I adenylate-forming enzyme family protein [Kurthia sibirica]|uniref:Long-chain fatty acid--CoA ligase n=1 Tax=Kurthia sibirica TaxID=202750 RepID=A0A2U3APS7_9BACL|nr:long-chain-fatty-acid--CoA ligase [Kurthia sibirica]PWI26516.1 long-chain fatty acid--CoA ligase [Kurthia sibirica]GEK32760.1 acyl-CoA synthetase [Kurthia sibirica]